MRYQDLQYFVLDFQEQNSRPELLRLPMGSNAHSILSDYCNMNGYALIMVGSSRPSMQRINEIVKFPILTDDGDFRA
jgi:hypothetical protein